MSGVEGNYYCIGKYPCNLIHSKEIMNWWLDNLYSVLAACVVNCTSVLVKHRMLMRASAVHFSVKHHLQWYHFHKQINLNDSGNIKIKTWLIHSSLRCNSRGNVRKWKEQDKACCFWKKMMLLPKQGHAIWYTIVPIYLFNTQWWPKMQRKGLISSCIWLYARGNILTSRVR